MLKPARRSDEGTLEVRDEEIHDEGDKPTSDMNLYTDTWFVQRETDGDGSGSKKELCRHDGCDDGDVYDALEDGEAGTQRQTEGAVAGSLSIGGKHEVKATPLMKRDDSSDKKKADEGVNK